MANRFFSKMNLMRGIKATLPAPLPVIISTSTTRIVKHRTIRRVPLHNPTNRSRLCSNITGAPILNGSLCEVMPLTSKVLKNSKSCPSADIRRIMLFRLNSVPLPRKMVLVDAKVLQRGLFFFFVHWFNEGYCVEEGDR